MDPASKMFVITLTTKEVSTADLVSLITFCILFAITRSSNYRGTLHTIKYLGGIKTAERLETLLF